MKKSIILLAIITIVGFGFYKKIYIPKHTYQTTQAIKGNIDISVNGIGNVDAKNIYKIGSLYGGKINSFTINEGQYIKKGDLIAIVDSVDLSNKIDEQKALKQKLLSDTNSLKIDKQSAQVNFNYQLELFKRNKKLFKTHSISSLDYQKYLTSKDTAKLKINSLDSKIISLQNQIKQTQANINGLQKKLDLYTIVAPINGYVTKKIVTNYQIIMPNQTLVEITNPKDIWVATYIDTKQSGKINIGDTATIKLQSNNKEYKGKVVNINPINNPITYEREVDVIFDNLPIPFYLQEQAKVKIDITTLKDVIKIPTKALVMNNKQNGTWILVDQKVKFKPLEILAYENKMAAVKGIDTNAKIVLTNPQKKTLSNGMTIYHD